MRPLKKAAKNERYCVIASLLISRDASIWNNTSVIAFDSAADRLVNIFSSEFLLKIGLPQLTSAADMEVDVGASDFNLFVPGFYKTEILFPQPVNKDRVVAKFSKRSKMLRISVAALHAAA